MALVYEQSVVDYYYYSLESVGRTIKKLETIHG